MAKGLLLGNGINSRLCINDLSVECIAERFKKNETKVWESKLKCKYELLESDDMK